MIKLIRFLFWEFVDVKPVTQYDDNGWLVLETSPLPNFLDDWYRYGLKIAQDNWQLLWEKFE